MEQSTINISDVIILSFAITIVILSIIALILFKKITENKEKTYINPNKNEKTEFDIINEWLQYIGYPNNKTFLYIKKYIDFTIDISNNDFKIAVVYAIISLGDKIQYAKTFGDVTAKDVEEFEEIQKELKKIYSICLKKEINNL